MIPRAERFPLHRRYHSLSSRLPPVSEGSLNTSNIAASAGQSPGQSFGEPRAVPADHQRASDLRLRDVERLAATYDHAGVGLVEIDADGVLLRVNAHLCELMGYTPDEMLGRSIFDETYAEDLDADLAQFRRQVAGEIDRYVIDKRLRRRDGRYIWCSVRSSSVRDPSGRFLYAVRVQHEIGDRKRAEEALAARLEEQAALHDFTSRLEKARSLEGVFEPALDAIMRGLRCERASVLLFDDAGAMRFVAWRGLSDGYRAAVDGHSPWARDAEDAAPICIADVARSDLDAALRQTVQAEGIGAVLFIPLREGGRLLGKFMAYYDGPHAFTRSEMDLARTVAGQLGFSIERIRAQKAANQLVAIVESSEDAIVSKDLNGIISTWNRGAERLFGYTAEEAVGQPVTIVIPEDRLGEEPKILQRIRRGERVDHFETVRRRKDGTKVQVSLTVSPVKDRKGAIVGASKIARNIGAQKLAEAKIRDSERALQELLAAIPAAIYTTDADGVITYFNEAAVSLAGRTPVVGEDRWCITERLYLPDGTPLPHDQCPMATALKEGRAIRNVEAVAERPDGSRVPFIPFPTPLRDAEGRIVGGLNMLVDISERKQAETQQRVLLNELNHRVKNNMQMLQALLHSAGTRTGHPEAKLVLAEASGRLAAMAAAQRIFYDSTLATRFTAAGFLEAVCNAARESLSTKIDIDCRDDSEISNEVAMPLALILYELLTNAAKHGPKGAPVQVGFRRDAGQFELYVEDAGPGFKIAAVRKGTSGLRLVQGLASQLRGLFDVQCQPRTRCSLRFP